MIKENGIITHADSKLAWVKTTRSGACEHCSTKDSCGEAHNKKELILTVPNTLNVKAGDPVVVGIQTRPMLYLTFLIYVFPIILMIVGAVIGNSIAPSLQMNPSVLSMIIGFSFFGSAFYYIRKKHDVLSQDKAYKPFLVKKRSQATPRSCSAP